MKIKTIQWNVGGGRYRDQNSDPLGDTYQNHNIEYFSSYIKQHNPDIVTLQESHTSENYSFAEELTKTTDLKYFVDYGIDRSHIDLTKHLTVPIISKYPIFHIEKVKFINPKLEIEWNGQKFPLQDKGVLKALIEFSNTSLNIESTHLFPLRKCNADLKDSSLDDLKKDIETKLINNTSEKLLIQGDFNINSELLANYFPNLVQKNTLEVKIQQPTTPRGRNYDHIIYRGLKLSDFLIDSGVLTDHYSLISIFDL